MAHDDEPTIIERVPAHEAPQGTTSSGSEKPVHSPQTAQAVETDGRPIRADSLPPSQPQDLQSRCQLLEQALQKRTQQRDLYKARYQTLATELSKLKSPGRGSSQLDDSYLIQIVENLRVKIWNFTLNHFGGPVTRGQREIPDSLLSHYAKRILRSDKNLEFYLENPDWRPMIIEAFLWWLMVAEVFNKFWWAGDAGRSIRKIYEAMKQSEMLAPLPSFLLIRPTGHRLTFFWPLGSSSSASDIQTFQTWSAATTKLIHESQKRDGLAWSDSRTKGKLGHLVNDIYESIEPYYTTTHDGLTKAIRDILNQAIALDESLSEQLAQFQWEFPGPQAGHFDADRMQLADGEVAAYLDGPMQISIFICPGIIRRGRSSGEEFGKDQLLIPIKVSCVAPLSPERAQLVHR